jgi:aminopeptidase N
MRALLGTLVALALTVVAPVSASADPSTIGAPGFGDPYYPLDGTGGYDVTHYDIRLSYQPSTDELWGTTTILARTTQDLSQFNLDFLLTPSSVRVNNAPAAFESQGDGELVVRPASLVRDDSQLLVVVTYRDVPGNHEMDGRVGWSRIPGGAAALGEPHIARWWFPGNDHPRDKATYDVSIAVPKGLEAVSNGIFVGARQTTDGWVRYNWRSRSPQGPYQATMIVTDLDITSTTTPSGLPYVNAYYTGLQNQATARAAVERTPEFLDWESSLFGPYPFEATGGTVLPNWFGLENQTRPTYGEGVFASGGAPYVVVHEQAHQWFGNSVSVWNWSDIWLSEGFATYAEWLYSEHIGEGTAAEVARYYYDLYPADNAFWQTVVTEPGPGDTNFATAVYRRGAMALQALRETIGDGPFFELLKKWPTEKKFGNATSAEFEAMAERVSGQDLDALFDTWLHTSGKPATAPVMGAAAVPASVAHMR